MIDEKYTNLLKTNNSLSLKECLWLDAVQKHHPITKEAAKHLYDKGLIEGRAPHYTISPTMFLPSLSTCRHLRYRSSLLATV